jgi:hypothetical protein
MSHAASLAITSARILVAVDICSSPPLSDIKPSRIYCLTFSSCSVVMLSSRRFLNSRKPMLEGVHVAWRSAFAFQSSHFVFPTTGFIFPQLFGYGKAVAM